MAFKALVNSRLRDLKELKWRACTRRHEIDKYKDPARKAVCDSVTLTPEQEQQIDDFFLGNYGEKVPYTWHKYYTAFSGVFHADYFPELLYIPEFEHFMNYHASYGNVIADKNITAVLARAAGIRSPEVILSCAFGFLKDGQDRPCSRKEAAALLEGVGTCFAKLTVETRQGKGCHLVCVENGVDTKSGKPAEEVLRSLGDNFVVQRLIRCHSSLAALNPSSVNTIRLITYRWGNELRLLPMVMRIGQGGNFVDNGHAGGLSMAVEDDGSLHRYAYSMDKTLLAEHPDTHVVFEGYKLPHMDRVREAALAIHRQVPQLGIAHWDFTVDEEGQPVLIEVNTAIGGSIWPIQLTHGKTPFGEHTAEILQWTRQMKHMGVEEQSHYLYGKMKQA